MNLFFGDHYSTSIRMHTQSLLSPHQIIDLDFWSNGSKRTSGVIIGSCACEATPVNL